MTETALAKSQAQQNPIVVALDARMPALADMLPGGEEAARRFKRVVIQAIIKNPDLQKCSPNSIVSAVMDSAAIGIEPTGTLGGAYLVPYGQTATLIVGYRGLIELARRSGEIDSIEAHVVRDGDEFEYEYGTNAHVRHVPDLGGEPDRALTFVYAVAKLRGGGTQFEVMTRDQVDAIRGRSKSGRSGPWSTDYDEMARKTVVRRLVKYLPIAIEARDVIERDDADFEPGAVVARVSGQSRSNDLRHKIANRTAALRGEEPPDEPDEGEEQATEPALDALPFDQGEGTELDIDSGDVVPSPACSHPDHLRMVDARGVVCGGCAVVLATREPADDDLPDIPPSDDDRGRLMRRLHADLTHDQVRDIAAAVLKIDAAEWSLADRSDEELERVARFVEGVSMEAATSRVAQLCAARGLVVDADDPWPSIDPLVVAITGNQPEALTPAQWVAFGLRVAAGDVDPVPEPPREAALGSDRCSLHDKPWRISATGKSATCPVAGCNQRAARSWLQARLLAAV